MARHVKRKVGEGGDVVIPKNFRDEFGIEPGEEVEFEDREDGILLRPAEGEKSRTGRRSD